MFPITFCTWMMFLCAGVFSSYSCSLHGSFGPCGTSNILYSRNTVSLPSTSPHVVALNTQSSSSASRATIPHPDCCTGPPCLPLTGVRPFLHKRHNLPGPNTSPCFMGSQVPRAAGRHRVARPPTICHRTEKFLVARENGRGW